MKIRKAKRGDLNEIDKIYLEGVIDEIKLQFPERTRLSIIKKMNKAKRKRLTGWKKELNSPKNYWIVAEIDKKIIGFANVEIGKDKEGRLTFLYIRKNFRKKGIGRKLTEERIKWLKSKNIKRVESSAYLKNKPSINNLKKIGFTPISIRFGKKLK